MSSASLRCQCCSQNNIICTPIPNKWSCTTCISLGIGCIFIPPIPTHDSSSALLSPNCVECTRSHRRCAFSNQSSKKCIRCTKKHLDCYFKFSERGRRTDLSPRTINTDPTRPLAVNRGPKFTPPINIDPTRAPAMNRGQDITPLINIHPTRPLAMNRGQEMTPQINIHPTRTPDPSQDDAISWCGIVSDPGAFFPTSGRSHYPPSIPDVSCGASCHARVEFSHHDQNGTHPPVYVSPGVPPWVHVFSKSTQSSSLRTQLASVAHFAESISHKSRNNRKNRAKKKFKKQQRLLREVVVPPNVTINLLSTKEIDKEIIVFDGGNNANPPLRPPDGVNWRCISIATGTHLHVEDETNPDRGLTYARLNNALPFIRMPRSMALNIIGKCSITKIYNALDACEKMRKVSLVRSDRKRVFGDYGKPVTYTCVGVQVSRNSRQVFDSPPCMDKLPSRHWEALTWIMRRAEICFEELADHQVVSHMRNAKAAVPFKTMSLFNHTTQPSCKYYGGLAFGCNVFLRCHTDQDFTMSIVQIFLKGTYTYRIDDDVVVYFCFPTLGVAVPLRPGDYLMFNALVPHCVSSRCNNNDNVIVLSMYMKSSVVGMNNNALELTPEQAILAKRFQATRLLKLSSPNRQRHVTNRYEAFYKSL